MLLGDELRILLEDELLVLLGDELLALLGDELRTFLGDGTLCSKESSFLTVFDVPPISTLFHLGEEYFSIKL